MRQFQHAYHPESIAIFRALQLGDLLCTAPAMRSLRAAYPRARIALVGLPWASSFVERFSRYLDEFIEFPGWPGLPEQPPQIERVPAFLQAMQARNFGLAIQMHGSGTITNPLVSLFGARQVCGYFQPGADPPENGLFVPYPEGESEIRIFLKLAALAGAEPAGEHLEFPVFEQEKQAFDQLLQAQRLSPGGYACLHAGARASERRWAPEKFAALGDHLHELGLRVVLTGSPAERGITREVASQMQAPALDLAGETGLGELGMLIANARLLVSNDTGVSHIAAAFETPSILFFSASDPARWQPLNRSLHRAVRNASQVEPGAVIPEIDSLLQETKAYAGSTI